MNEQLQQALASILTKTTQAVESSINFLSEQLPDVVRQLLMWQFTYHLVKFCLGVILCAVGGIVIYKVNQAIQKLMKESPHAGNDFLYVTLSVVGILFFVVVYVSCINLTWLKIWLAPKIYLIEYAATLVKGH